MPSSVLSHRGIEVWLENSNGCPIALSEGGKIESYRISTWVNVTPRQVGLSPLLGQSSLASFFFLPIVFLA